VNLPFGQIEKALKLLEVDGAVAHERGRFFRTPNPWEQDEEWVAGVLAARRRELASMQAYVETAACRMEFLSGLLDDASSRICGHCANDGGVVWPRDVDPTLVREAVTFLRRDVRVIEPRRRWPSGAAIDLANEEGRALCVYGDPGWGQDVKRGKYEGSRFDDTLVEVASDVIRRRWRPAPAPAWVTAVPSRARSTLVGDFASRLAASLGLPYAECLTSLVEAAPQKDMQNSAQQAANARRKLGIVPSAVLPGPVLLVDDIVDSRWTLTVAGSLLREHGSGPVLPFALAVASMRDA
jgi:ATP-dependent DNA helicase RecQ